MNWNFNLSGQTNMNIEAQIVVLIKLDSEVIPTIFRFRKIPQGTYNKYCHEYYVGF